MSAVTITTLGSNGRLANSLFQYATGKALAYKYDCALEVPSNWWGRQIFDIKDHDITHQFNAQTPIDYIPSIQDLEQFKYIDLLGYWQFQEAMDLYSLKDLMFWLRPRKEVITTVREYIYQRVGSKDFITVHKRRGDYISKYADKYAIITDASFNRGVRMAKDHLAFHRNILDPEIIELTEENPAPDINSIPGWIIDFFMMAYSSAVVRSNSTYSLWGGIYCLNYGGTVFSPVVENNVGWYDAQFIEGNWPRCADVLNHPSSRLTDLHLRTI